MLGGSGRSGCADPRDAQYLNTTAAGGQREADALAAEGIIKLEGEYARPTAALMERRAEFEEKLAEALEFTRPKFNEDMRSGHTNM